MIPATIELPMDFERIRRELDHYESIARRLTFRVNAWTDESVKPPVERYSVECGAGVPVQYERPDSREEAQRICDARNARAAAFLAAEAQVVRGVLVEEASKLDAAA